MAEDIQATELKTEKTEPQFDVAVCPHCGADPVEFKLKQLMSNDGIVVLAAYCATATCRKLLPLSFMAQAQPKIFNPFQA